MRIWVDKTKPEELDILQAMEEESFKINEKYFEGGVLPELSEDDQEKHSWKARFADPAYELFSIYDGERLIGGARAKPFGYFNAEMELFFICPEYQGKGIAAEAFIKAENMLPEVRFWCFVTPTQVTRNAAFYVNKCGYAIVEVVEYDDQTDNGMFVFEKIKY